MKDKRPTKDLAISIPPRDGRKVSIQVEASYFMQTFLYIFIRSGRLWGSLLAQSDCWRGWIPWGARPPFRRASGVDRGSHQPKPLDTMFILEIRNRCL